MTVGTGCALSDGLRRAMSSYQIHPRPRFVDFPVAARAALDDVSRADAAGVPCSAVTLRGISLWACGGSRPPLLRRGG